MLLRFIIQIKLSPSPKVEEDIIMRQKIINQEHGKKKKQQTFFPWSCCCISETLLPEPIIRRRSSIRSAEATISLQMENSKSKATTPQNNQIRLEKQQLHHQPATKSALQPQPPPPNLHPRPGNSHNYHLTEEIVQKTRNKKLVQFGEEREWWY